MNDVLLNAEAPKSTCGEDLDSESKSGVALALTLRRSMHILRGGDL
jgi:hypothetical protein